MTSVIHASKPYLLQLPRRLDENFNTNLKFHHLTSAEKSRFASTPWSPPAPAPLSLYHGAISPVVGNYVSKTEGLVCSAIEAHEHSLELLEALTKIFPPGEGDFRVTQLVSCLACTVYPMRDALYKQFGNLCILHRESALHAADKTDEPDLEVLRRAPVLSSSTEEQYSAATLAQVAMLEQSLTNQNTASALHTLASQQGGNNGLQQPSKPSSGPAQGASRSRGSRRRKPFSRPSQSEAAPAEKPPEIFDQEGERGRSLDRWVQDSLIMHLFGHGARTTLS